MNFDHDHHSMGTSGGDTVNKRENSVHTYNSIAACFVQCIFRMWLCKIHRCVWMMISN